ncbi:Crp/Fnr family transcriptional regulator [Paenibacillus sp. H1-7]|uniref:Crp/Fnr family transcriptional regulator n=1 Tax=Paenibacillus sp. H1-7 TaxID=2282849 RepID=UPI001EF7ADCB|nr:Crp/Fnr family transcriptional regulator [Paenibacillus sp. H1-7]
MDLYNDLTELKELKNEDPTKEAILDAFRKYGVRRSCRKNEYVFQENDPPDGAYYVQSGLIKISQSSEEGQGITLFLRYEGEVFGNAELLAGVKRRRYARALSDCQLLVLDGVKYTELAKENPEFAYSVAVLGARRLLQTQQTVEALISRPAAWRLAWFIMKLGKPTGRTIEAPIPLSHEEISYVIGCSRQTVTEILNKWREQGLIEYTKKSIVIVQPEHFFSTI